MKRNVFLAASAAPKLRRWLESEGFNITEISTEGIVPAPVSDHPDMFMCRLGINDGAEIISYESPEDIPAGSVYPYDIAFNAACTGRYFIHNLKHTCPRLREAAEELGMIMVDVKQGYAKCSTVILDEDSVITYDRGLAKACEKTGLNVLIVSPGHVLLPGYDSGFIGGASGRIGDTIIFNGDLSAHPDFTSIKTFIKDRGLHLKWFEDWPLTDIGSII